jgi:hypothetical protein
MPPQIAIACARVGIGDVENGERHRQEQRRPDTGDAAPGHQDRRVGRQRADQRAGGEDGDAEDEDPAPAVEIAERAPGEDQRGIGEVVEINDPLQRRRLSLEILLDRLEAEIDERGIEDGHEGAERHHGEDRRGFAQARTHAMLLLPLNATTL